MNKGFLILIIFKCFGATAQINPAILELKVTHLVEANAVQDQSMSSTCWSFASNSFLESELMRHNIQHVKLSEMYIARYSYINKVNQYLALKGLVFFTPGGQFHDVLKVIKKYGMLPEEFYNGRLNKEGPVKYDHEKLDTAMKRYAQKLLAEKKLTTTKKDLIELNNILDSYLGKVPATFSYHGKTYTPVSFAINFLHFKASDYIELTSYTHHPPYSRFVLEDKYNWTLDSFYNLPIVDFMAVTDSALKNNYTICWDGDVEEPGFKYEEGIAYLLNNQESTDMARQTTFEDKTTSIDHMMHVIGTAIDKNNNSWYYLKNSWGGSTNPFGGYLFMQKEYFKIKTVAIIINKNAIPSSIRRKMKL